MPETLITRTATLSPGADGVYAAILSTFADVVCSDARGRYIERIAGEIIARADRIPITDSHHRDRLPLGHVDGITQNGTEVRGTLHVINTQARALIESGSLSGVSIGILPTSDKWSSEGGQRVRTISAATIHEVALTGFPADDGATILRNEHMDTVTDPAIVERAALNVSIRALCTTARMPATFADQLIDRAATSEEVRLAIADAIIARGPRVPAFAVGPSGDDPAVVRSRVEDALVHRLGGMEDLPEASRQYANMGFHMSLRSILAARGDTEAYRLSVPDLIVRAISTSDLPALTEATTRRFLLPAFNLALTELMKLVQTVSVPDFRALVGVRLGEMPALEKIVQGGEVNYGGVAESSEQVKLETWGRIVSWTREAMISDDLNALGTVSAGMGRQAAQTLSNLIVALLTSNSGVGPTMNTDNKALFHVDHGNLAGSGGAISATTLAAGVAAMRNTKAMDGVSPMNLTPIYLIVPVAKETLARQAVAAIYPPTQADANVQTGAFEVLVDPRLTGNAWYLACGKDSSPVLFLAYLSSAPGPQVVSRMGFETLGIDMRIILDAGVFFQDYRGIYRNPGA